MEKRKLFFILFLIITSFLSANVLVQLKYNTIPQGNVLYLKDIASVYSNYESLKEKVENILISKGNLPDKIDKKTVYMKLINYGINHFNVTGPREVLILKKRAKSYNIYLKKRIEEYVKQQFPYATSLKIAYQKVPEIKAFKGESVKIIRYGKGFSNSFLLKVLLVKNKNIVEQKFAQVFVKVWAKVPVAKHFIPRGKIIGLSDIRWEIREVNYSNHRFVKDPNFLIGKKAKYSVNPGNVIVENLLMNKVSVKRGDLVKIILKYNFIKVTSVGKAITSGELGKLIRVLNLKSRKILMGKVVGDDIVEVSVL